MRDATVELLWHQRIELRDGIELNANIYVPRKHPQPGPAVCILTPYMSDAYHERGVYFASHGLTFAIVDVRGRGNSEGTFRPMIQESQDGYDVVEWLAEQPYCNGKVGMWGGSYSGYSQWATAKGRPPHLATIVPVAAPCFGIDFPMRRNIFYPYLVQWISFVSGRVCQTGIFSDAKFWSSVYRMWHESGRPFRDLDSVAGNPSPLFQEWLRHPEPDAYWNAYNPTAEQYAKLDIPVLTITGTYDDDQPGALEHYKAATRNGSQSTRANHYLILGPWDHAGTRTPSKEFGGVDFGNASLIDLPKLHREWYAWTMQDGPRPEFLRKTVAYYVMSANRWRYADSLDDITDHYERYFLDSSCNACDVFSSGVLGPAPAVGDPDSYSYDPRDTHGLEVHAEAMANASSLVDQSIVLALHGKCLVYHSGPFGQDTEISGFFRLVLWIAIDCPDTDLYVSVHEICLDGTSIRLSTDAVRARYRGGARQAELISTRDALQYDFECFTFVSRLIRRGHRLRLVIAPVGRLIESTFIQKNYNGGGKVAEESVKDAQPVTITLFHDRSRPSALYAPIGREILADEATAPHTAFLYQPRYPEAQ